jgi:hypothetical protein
VVCTGFGQGNAYSNIEMRYVFGLLEMMDEEKREEVESNGGED